jgi:GR25 family glycosyltransferase involved in LPS biosynthesis
MAHKNIWDKLINDENEIVYLICEDDCKPSDLFDITLLNSFDYSKIDLLYLQAITAHHQDKQLLVNQYKETNWDKNLKIIDKHKGLMCEGFAAYCITKQGAKKLCEYIETNGYDGPIDNLVTHVDNFTCVCPSNIKNYFYLNEIADYSFTHSGTFTFNYKLNNIELQSQNQLKIKNKG